MTEVFGPQWGNASLRTIIEAQFPEPIPLIPTTPGWWILFFALLGLLLRAFWHRRQRYLRDRYRRSALTQLATIKARLGAGELEAVRKLAPLLRATAIAAVGRDALSGLQGDAYAAALAELAPDQDRLPVADIQRLAYAPLDDVEGLDLDSFIARLERWIEQHRAAHA
ncbi:MAG: DUF4381 domain-containing protein [Halioglobus sp.]